MEMTSIFAKSEVPLKSAAVWAEELAKTMDPAHASAIAAILRPQCECIQLNARQAAAAEAVNIGMNAMYAPHIMDAIMEHFNLTQTK